MTQKLRQETLTLVTKAQQGDRLAFSQIVRQFQDLAVGYAYSILRNFPLAEEAAQEAFIEAYLNLDRLLNPAAFPGWLKKIVLKHCDRITRKKRPPFVSLTQTGELISSQLNPTSIAEAREFKDQIQQAIELLPKAEREVVTLFYLGDRSQKEISAFLEVPISTIKNRLYSARNRLKPQLNTMVEDYLYDRRPSQDDTFANLVIQTVKAACNGDDATIQTLLEQDANLAKAKDNYIYTTALHCAAHRGYLNIVKLLLAAGADVNAKEGNYSQSTPLHWAATGGHLEMTQTLVENGAKLNVRDNWNNLTPLGWAIMVRYDHGDCPMGDNHQEIREYLISKGAQLDIFSAIAIDDGDQIKELIKSNREVLNQRLGFALDELQPLHYAIQEDKTEIAQLLIEQGANLQAQTRFGVTPLCMAIQVGNQNIVRLLTDRNVPRDLSTLIVTEQWSQAQSAINAQPNLIAEKSLLLHYTIKQGLLEATSWLLEKGVDIEIRDKYELDDYVASLTPLHVAVEAERVEIAQLLIESGADINTKTTGELEITALHSAAADGYLDLIRLLVKHQANLNAKDNVRGGTPLDYAKNYKQEAAVKLLQQLKTEK